MKGRHTILWGCLLWALRSAEPFSFSSGPILFGRADTKRWRACSVIMASSDEDIVERSSTDVPSPPPYIQADYISFSPDIVQDAWRRTAFEKLQKVVASLATLEGDDAIQLVPNSVATQRRTNNLARVDALVFLVDDWDPVLVIVRDGDEVDTSKVADLFECGSVREAQWVESLCGFPPGSIPPLGHSPDKLRTVLDSQLLNQSFLWAGGGHPDYGCVIAVETLLKLRHVETGDVILTPENEEHVEVDTMDVALPLEESDNEHVETETKDVALTPEMGDEEVETADVALAPESNTEYIETPDFTLSLEYDDVQIETETADVTVPPKIGDEHIEGISILLSAADAPEVALAPENDDEHVETEAPDVAPTRKSDHEHVPLTRESDGEHGDSTGDVEAADVTPITRDNANQSASRQAMRDEVTGDDAKRNGYSIPKPFLPISPPQKEIAQLVCNDPASSNPLTPTEVTVMGRLASLRRSAKRLVFADLAPPDHVANADNVDLRPWRSGTDGEDMAVRLIAGKILCQTLGDVAGPAALSRLKPGQLILVKGKTNVVNRGSLQNWVTKRCLDIVVVDYQLIKDAPTLSQQTIRQNNTELQRLQLTDSVAPMKKNADSVLAVANATSVVTLSDIFTPDNGKPPVIMVDNVESVHDFAGKISQLLMWLTTANGHVSKQEVDPTNSIERTAMIGVDSEWRPSFFTASSNIPQPTLLLQISVQPLKQVFLFDTQALFRPLQDPLEAMTDLEAAASETLLNVFSSQRLLKVGFQLVADLQRLASSYPHIPAFHTFHSIVEVSTIANKAMQMAKTRNVQYHTDSLARLAEFMVGKTIDKRQQISDWAIRPLSKAQIEYAALDAAVSPLILEKALHMSGAGVMFEQSDISSYIQLGRWKDDPTFEGSVMSWRFLPLETNDPKAIRKLKAKRVVGEPYVVAQRWRTGEEAPSLPSMPGRNGDGPYTDANGVFRVPSNLIRITAGKDADTVVDHLVGQRVGTSKEFCIESLLTGEAALRNDAKIDFNQRLGYVEFEDGVAVFVNEPDKDFKRGYPNEWLDWGRIMTWYLRDHEWEGGASELAQKLIGPSQSELILGSTKVAPVVVLFVRMARGMYICCGRCRVVISEIHEKDPSETPERGLVELQLELLDWDMLELSTDFADMVEGWVGPNRNERGDAKSSSSVNVLESASSEPEEGTNDQEKMSAIAEIVLRGNVVGAISLALKRARIPGEERSIEVGVETLKKELMRDGSDVSMRALEYVINLYGETRKY